jgi:hypothetical protein
VTKLIVGLAGVVAGAVGMHLWQEYEDLRKGAKYASQNPVDTARQAADEIRKQVRAL